MQRAALWHEKVRARLLFDLGYGHLKALEAFETIHLRLPALTADRNSKQADFPYLPCGLWQN